jgi:hypothetical protein
MKRRTPWNRTPSPAAPLLACAVVAAACAFAKAAAADETLAESPGPIEVAYEGHVEVDGHYERPGERRTFGSRIEVLWDGWTRLRLDAWTWSEGDSTRALESTLLLDDRVLLQGSGRTTWLELEGSRADQVRLQALACLPEAIPRFPNGRTWNVELHRGVPIRVRSDVAHVRLGDFLDMAAYGDPASPVPENHFAPATIRGTFGERDAVFTVGEGFVSAQVPDSDRIESRLAAPADSLVTGEDPARAPSPPRVEEIADGIWSIERDQIDSRSLVVEMADSLVVIESAVGSPQGEELVRIIHERWPGVPIRVFMFSHHHPHYLGGVRAFMAEGATVLTTRGNENYVTQMGMRYFTLEPDALALNPKFLEVVPFDRKIVLSDARNEIVAIDIGPLSSHTDEFVIFFFPRQKLLFQAELGWSMPGGTLRASRRAAGLLQAMQDNHLHVDRLVQSWPIVGNQREMTFTDFRALVAARGG